MIATATSRSDAVGDVQAGRFQRASEAQVRGADGRGANQPHKWLEILALSRRTTHQSVCGGHALIDELLCK
jgi:hypothetical protein